MCRVPRKTVLFLLLSLGKYWTIAAIQFPVLCFRAGATELDELDFVRDLFISEKPRIIVSDKLLRLHARDEPDLAALELPKIIQFRAFSKWFTLLLEPHTALLPSESVVRLVESSTQRTFASRIEGEAFVGTRIIVTPEKLRAENLTRAMFDALGELEPPFARFFITRHKSIVCVTLLMLRYSARERTIVQGGFTYRGEFFKVDQSSNPLIRPLAMKARRPSSKTDDDQSPALVVTRSSPELSITQTRFGGKYRCAHDRLGFNTKIEGAISYLGQALHKHPIGADPRLSKRADDGCPVSRKALYIGIAADCNYVRSFQGDKAAIQANIISDFNIVSGIYDRYFNVDLGILVINIMMDCSGQDSDAAWNVPCDPNVDIDQRLNEFSEWRNTQTKDAGLFHMVSGCSESETVGIAWLNQVCQTESFRARDGNDIISGTSVSVLIPNQFAVIAHEIGHNFGAVHDCDAQVCEASTESELQCCACSKCDCKGQFIMNPESGGLHVKAFSPCSQSDICAKMPMLATCLKEPGTLNVVAGGICGNGIREGDEECDCGGQEGCVNNECCTADCKLTPGSQCDDHNDRCCENCRVLAKELQKVCRPANTECQLDAICNGTSGDCPVTLFAKDGETCELSDGRCASGVCTSRDRQCAVVGSRLGFTTACPLDHGCKITCATKSGCVMVDANFIDGTPCGNSGFCKDGECSESLAETFIRNNLWWVVVVGSLLGLSAVIGLVSCICNAIRNGRRTYIR